MAAQDLAGELCAATLLSLLAPPRAKISFRTAIEWEGKGSLQGTSSSIKKKVPLGGRIFEELPGMGFGSYDEQEPESRGPFAPVDGTMM